jgi:tripartite ATP-independent transporter DctP family solute receptor
MKIKWLFIGWICLSLLNACSQAGHTKKIKLAHVLDKTHPVHLGMEFMAKKVKEKSNGTLQIDIYPSGQLGAERECLELLQIGSLGMTKVSASVMENFVPDYKVFSMPYIFTSKTHQYSVLDSEIGKNILQQGEQYWLRGMCFYDAGSRSFYTKKPVKTPEDLNGMKIRVMNSNTAINMVNTLGGSATPISYGELYTALQQGVVDGAENNPPSLYMSKHYEVCKYYTINEHTSVPDVLVMSTIIWNTLTPQEQQWLQEAATESMHYQRKIWEKSEQESIAEMKKAGVEVIVLTPEQKAVFAQKVAPMYEQYKTEKSLYDLIQKIQKAETQPQ